LNGIKGLAKSDAQTNASQTEESKFSQVLQVALLFQERKTTMQFLLSQTAILIP
jgi:hypothetical protein